MFKHTGLLIIAIFINAFMNTTLACSCIIDKDGITTNIFSSKNGIIIKGKVIELKQVYYYDTLALSNNGIIYNEEKHPFLRKAYLEAIFVVEEKFKVKKNIQDTILVLTEVVGDMCGYEFEKLKDYILFAENFKEKILIARKGTNEKKTKIKDATDKFYTNRCTYTQESTEKVLMQLRKLVD